MKRLLIPLVILAVLILIVWLVIVQTTDGKPARLTNCTEAKALGIHDIPKSSVYYRPQLDRDNNSVACEL